MEFCSEDSVHSIFAQVMRLQFCRTHTLLEGLGVYPGQPPLLFLLYRKNGQSQKELASKMGIKPSTLTVMIKRMEKSGLVSRKQDDSDQRVSRIFITEEGIELCKKVAVVHRQIEEESYLNFTMEEKILLKRLLMQVRDNLQKLCEDEENNKEKNLSCKNHI